MSERAFYRDDSFIVPQNGLYVLPGVYEEGLNLEAFITSPVNWPNPGKLKEYQPGKYRIEFPPQTWGDPVSFEIWPNGKTLPNVTRKKTTRAIETKSKKWWSVALVGVVLLAVIGLTTYSILTPVKNETESAGVAQEESGAKVKNKQKKSLR